MTTHIGIIGGGLSGTATLTHLVGELTRQQKRDVTITMFDPAPIGPGIVYGADLPDSILLNHPNKLMGSVSHLVTDDKRDDFFKWMQQNSARLKASCPSLQPDNPEGFSPRRIYGEYLMERYAQAKEYAKAHGITVLEVHKPVTAVQKQGQFWEIKAGDGPAKPYQQVVVCSGHWYRGLPKEWQQTGRAFLAYPLGNYIKGSEGKAGGTLLIRGTGLTAVDATIAAIESGRYAHVIMASRRGQLHALQGPKNPNYEPKFLTIDRLESEFPNGQHYPLKRVIELLRMEIEDAYKQAGKPAPNWNDIVHPKDMHAWLKAQVEQIDRGEEFLWRSVIDKVDLNRQKIYARLSPQDQEIFQDEYRNLYISYRASTPPPNGRKLLHYMEEGKLTITGGMINLSYDEASGKFVTEIAKYPDGTPYNGPEHAPLPKDVKVEKLQADVLVDAIGQTRSVKASPLLNAMLKEGIAKEHAQGGLQLDAHMGILDRHGQPQPGIYAIGNLSDGQHINHSSSLNLTDNTRRLATHMVAELAKLPATPQKPLICDQTQCHSPQVCVENGVC